MIIQAGLQEDSLIRSKERRPLFDLDSTRILLPRPPHCTPLHGPLSSCVPTSCHNHVTARPVPNQDSGLLGPCRLFWWGRGDETQSKTELPPLPAESDGPGALPLPASTGLTRLQPTAQWQQARWGAAAGVAWAEQEWRLA